MQCVTMHGNNKHYYKVYVMHNLSVKHSDRHMGMCVHDIVLVTRCVGSVEVILANEFHLRCICTSVLLKVCIIIIYYGYCI